MTGTPSPITQAQLKQLLHYCPETGQFIWRHKRGRQAAGSVAGTLTFCSHISISINGKRHYAHRLAYLYMTGDWPLEQVDHINHDGADNRWSNLRLVSYLENCQNVPLYAGNKSGVCGVFWEASRQKWKAYITVSKKRIELGRFDDLLSVVAARKTAEQQHDFHRNHGKRGNHPETRAADRAGKIHLRRKDRINPAQRYFKGWD
jgi:hypothetical protein